jgi:hypothetical protein
MGLAATPCATTCARTQSGERPPPRRLTPTTNAPAILTVLAVADVVRPESREAFDALRQRGEVVMQPAAAAR